MGLQFGKGGGAKPFPGQQQGNGGEAAAAPKPFPGANTVAGKPATPPQGASSKPQPSFLMRGAQAAQAHKQEEAKAEAAKEEMGKLWEFFMSPGEDVPITFLDGHLIKDGDEKDMLDCPTYYRHTVPYAGKWGSFICTEGVEGQCPLCASGDKKQLVGVLTIIDHSTRHSRDGTKTYVDQKRLFVAPRTVLSVLTKIAQKKGGLAGHTFEVSRTDSKSARCGSMFEHLGHRSPDELVQTYGPEKAQPANYQEELVYRSAEQLLQMGLGVKVNAIGTQPASKTLMEEA